jgi:hypothetical protein
VRRRQVDSSVVDSVGYEGGVLEVGFRNGGVYRYHGVPRAAYLALMGAPSKGRFFNRHVRDAYPAECLVRAGAASGDPLA